MVEDILTRPFDYSWTVSFNIAHALRRVILVQNNFIFALVAVSPRFPVGFERGANFPDGAVAVLHHRSHCLPWLQAFFINPAVEFLAR